MNSCFVEYLDLFYHSQFGVTPSEVEILDVREGSIILSFALSRPLGEPEDEFINDLNSFKVQVENNT